MNDKDIIRVETTALARPTVLDFDALIEMVRRAVKSIRSQRAYIGDLEDWRAWAIPAGYDPTIPHFTSLGEYVEHLAGRGLSRATIQRRAAAVRKLASMAAITARMGAHPAAIPIEAASDSLRHVKVSVGRKQVRQKRALNPAEADRAMRAWSEHTNKARRNRALVALALATGARRAELAALRWEDVDFDANTIHILSGKGDEERWSPIGGQEAVKALQAWRDAQGEGREFIFCGVNKGDRLGPDSPLDCKNIYLVFRQTGARTGELFKPHDARRTFITEALATGTPLADVQADVGHKRPDTTLLYQQPGDAATRGRNLKLRYG